MTTIQEDLATLLNGLCPSGISPEVAIQNSAFPYLVYRRMPSSIANTLAGNGQPPINNTQFEISAWSDSYGGAVALAAQVTAAMQGWGTQNVLLREQDMFESDVRLFRVVQDYSVWHYN